MIAFTGADACDPKRTKPQTGDVLRWAGICEHLLTIFEVFKLSLYWRLLPTVRYQVTSFVASAYLLHKETLCRTRAPLFLGCR